MFGPRQAERWLPEHKRRHYLFAWAMSGIVMTAFPAGGGGSFGILNRVELFSAELERRQRAAKRPSAIRQLHMRNPVRYGRHKGRPAIATARPKLGIIWHSCP